MKNNSLFIIITIVKSVNLLASLDKKHYLCNVKLKATNMAKSLKKLCEENQCNNYFNFIIKSFMDGNFKKSKELYLEMKSNDKRNFRLLCSELGYESEMLKITL